MSRRLIISTWLWGNKYDQIYVDKLRESVKRNLRQDFDWRVFTPSPEDAALIGKACFCRLRMFDPEWQRRQEIDPGDRIALIDLDTVITGPLDELFDRPEPYLILHGGNAHNPCPYNGALQMLRAGAYPEVWRDFSLESASKIAYFQFPDDQGWIWHKLPDAAGWRCGKESGIYVFRKPGWPGWTDVRDALHDNAIPDGARMVTFSGKRCPRDFEHLTWVKDHWRV